MKDEDRKKARDEAEKKSRRADMKQHADKIFQGLEKLEERHAKRAIWELFQNAIDISEKCEIIITITDKGIEFKHNGKPFTSETLVCLIKQVSSKNSENNDDEVGQYGTGFITTHSFGKKILLSGALEEVNSYIHLNDFEIDRIAKKSEELIEKLRKQEETLLYLIENGKQEEKSMKYTTFKYIATNEQEKLYAEKVISDLELILPYVMTINQKLQKVEVIDKLEKRIIYEKGTISSDGDLTITPICINQEKRAIYSILSEDKDITILLPLEEQYKAFSFDRNLSKLFLFYPLIGTEDFGFNFLVHSKKFAPTEPRDGIYLKSNNEQIQEKEKHNRELLQKTFELLVEFISNHCNEIQNAHLFAELNFNTNISNNISLSDYFKEIKKEWVNKFKTFPLVKTTESKLNPEDTMFFSEELLRDNDYFDSIYAIVSLFWENIPEKEIAKKWTEYVTQWEDGSIKYITIEQVTKKIEEKGMLDFFKDVNDLKHFYEYLIKTSDSKIFDEHAILPNIKNEFKLKSELKNCSDIPDELLKIADIIIPDVPKHYIQKAFEFNLQFESYKKEQFVTDINSALSNIDRNEILYALIEYCSIFSDENAEQSMRGKFMEFVIKYYKKEQAFISISNLPERWWLTPIKCLFRLFINELNTKDKNWIKEHESFLYGLISIVNDYYEFQDILESLPLFPNQEFKLCKRNDLKIDNNIPEELKDLYDKIVSQSGKTIRSTLILNDFNSFLKEENIETPESLGNKIETKFQLQDCNDTNQHEYIQDIIKIIKIISDDSEWKKYFPNLESKKASIMLERISDGETKKDLFSIIGLERDKIRLLGELSRQNNLEKIVELGRTAWEKQQQDSATFRFKKYIGTHIEGLVRKKINADLIEFEIEVNEQQGGQDIIVKYKENAVYYIEVKSRWDSRNSITMSSVQMTKAVENKNIYSLCCVDMCDYKGEDRHHVDDIQEIIERITILSDIGNKIEPLLHGILIVNDTENEISLKDYRGVIPQNLLKKEGIKLDNFVSMLINVIEDLRNKDQQKCI